MAASPQLLLFSLLLLASSHLHPCLSSPSLYNRTIAMPSNPFTFDAAAAADDDSTCGGMVPLDTPGDVNSSNARPPSTLKLPLQHRSNGEQSRKDYIQESTRRDLSRFQTLTGRKTQTAAPLPAAATTAAPELAGRLEVTLESGVTLGSGEYFMDVFIGTPPRHLSLILDTGSDLNWIQCLPCHDCFDQHGPVYDPAASSSYRNVSCSDPRCGLVSSPDPPRRCDAGGDHPCPYFYWYGDRSNTTGDLALETFTVNVTHEAPHPVEGVIFGCGHWNRGLFHGAAGLLGLGRGPLSFSSQLRSLYGHAFSYCLVDRNSDLSVSSKLIFGEDPTLARHPDLNYTSFVTGKETGPVETFYYLNIKGITVGGELLDIAPETWKLTADGAGGTIIDSGTTLSYFTDPAFQVIKEAFVKTVKYPAVEGFPVLTPCYNVSGAGEVELPEFSILFADGAVWRFPAENYFIRLDPEEIMCLAFLGADGSSVSIIGNYQQQNFHVLYDIAKSRLGFAPMKCADV